MANRAYLYPSNQPDQWEWDRNEIEYYDSRHTFPILWWLLVSSKDLQLVDIHYSHSSWKEIRLSVKTSIALQRFKDRIDIHHDKLLEYISLSDLERFVDKISLWGSEYLIIDPSEIFQGDVEIDHPEMLRYIDSLDEHLDFGIAPYSIDSTDEVKLIGYTYS